MCADKLGPVARGLVVDWGVLPCPCWEFLPSAPSARGSLLTAEDPASSVQLLLLLLALICVSQAYPMRNIITQGDGLRRSPPADFCYRASFYCAKSETLIKKFYVKWQWFGERQK